MIYSPLHIVIMGFSVCMCMEIICVVDVVVDKLQNSTT